MVLVLFKINCKVSGKDHAWDISRETAAQTRIVSVLKQELHKAKDDSQCSKSSILNFILNVLLQSSTVPSSCMLFTAQRKKKIKTSAFYYIHGFFLFPCFQNWLVTVKRVFDRLFPNYHAGTSPNDLFSQCTYRFISKNVKNELLF